VVLTFEGVGNFVTVGNFYNGGAGGSLGVVFGSGSLALTPLPGGNGDFTNAPSGDTILFFPYRELVICWMWRAASTLDFHSSILQRRRLGRLPCGAVWMEPGRCSQLWACL
jgi:hypothetical protein